MGKSRCSLDLEIEEQCSNSSLHLTELSLHFSGPHFFILRALLEGMD